MILNVYIMIYYVYVYIIYIYTLACSFGTFGRSERAF